MRELPAGPDAVLLDFSDDPTPSSAVTAAAQALWRALEVGGLPDVSDVVPTAQTILVQSERGRGVDALGIRRALRTTRDAGQKANASAAEDEIRIPVTYDGPDLTDVAELLRVAPAIVGELHRKTLWRVQFMGFAPGFGYLVPQDDRPHPLARVARRDESRTRVPAGAVAIAAGYSAVYPRVSPGGWHLIGHTAAPMWDENGTPPALLAPGRLVRFVVEDVDT